MASNISIFRPFERDALHRQIQPIIIHDNHFEREIGQIVLPATSSDDYLQEYKKLIDKL